VTRRHGAEDDVQSWTHRPPNPELAADTDTGSSRGGRPFPEHSVQISHGLSRSSNVSSQANYSRPDRVLDDTVTGTASSISPSQKVSQIERTRFGLPATVDASLVMRKFTNEAESSSNDDVCLVKVEPADDLLHDGTGANLMHDGIDGSLMHDGNISARNNNSYSHVLTPNAGFQRSKQTGVTMTTRPAGAGDWLPRTQESMLVEPDTMYGESLENTSELAYEHEYEHESTYINPSGQDTDIADISYQHRNDQDTGPQLDWNMCQEQALTSGSADGRTLENNDQSIVSTDQSNVSTDRSGPYVCDLCQKCFRHRSSLTQHVRVHSGEKPFSCDVCGRSFNRMSTLKTHLHLHTGHRPFHCQHCDKTFIKQSHLTTHVHQSHS
jgi:hypothetical protein